MAATYHRTAYAVWEITLACNLGCIHCGSRAGEPRQAELTTAEALDLVQQLAEVGVDEVTLIGGEAFLRPDWLTIAQAITRTGMLCTMTTGGYGLSPTTIARMRDAGIALVSVSVDGLEATHDHLRGRPRSWEWCFRTLERLRAAGMVVTCNTQVNRLSAPELPRLYEHVRDAGVAAWQLQLTVPMGRAADNASILLQPPELLDLFPLLARLARRAWREGVRFAPADNIGYYGPYERILREAGHPWGFYQGPVMGLATLGIEADGTIKAEPSLPTRAYAAGNVREQPLRRIIEESERMNFTVGAGTPRATEHLWGFCKTCEFAELCRGGDPWTAHVFFDRRGNNPYCYHRAAVQLERGVRERLSLETPAEGLPFDNGVFSVIEEPAADPWPVDDPLHFTADRVAWPPDWPADDDGATGPITGATAAPFQPDEPAPVAPDNAMPGRPSRLLPRDGWESKAAFLRTLLRAKRALDIAEAEHAGVPG